MRDSTISGNTATLFDGGGIANDVGFLVLTNVTLSGNTAGANGGGIANGSGDAARTGLHTDADQRHRQRQQAGAGAAASTTAAASMLPPHRL